MTDEPQVPAPASDVPTWFSGIPKALIPASVKALDRLIGAAVNYPVSLIKRATAKVDAQTKAFELVEASIAKVAAESASGDTGIVQRAVETLVRKEYRRQSNKEAIAKQTVELLSDQSSDEGEAQEHPSAPQVDDDWLNVFERFAEDASTERMQGLWSRVLAGEIRKPGSFSMRTLRFLSEFSQTDGSMFSSFCDSAFGDHAPASLVKSEDIKDIRHLLNLEAAGLITGASGLGLNRTMTFSQKGHAFLIEGRLGVLLTGESNTSFVTDIVALTALGQELIPLLPNRDARAAARKVALAIRTPQIKSAFLVVLANDLSGVSNIIPMEIIWQETLPPGDD